MKRSRNSHNRYRYSYQSFRPSSVRSQSSKTWSPIFYNSSTGISPTSSSKDDEFREIEKSLIDRRNTVAALRRYEFIYNKSFETKIRINRSKLNRLFTDLNEELGKDELFTKDHFLKINNTLNLPIFMDKYEGYGLNIRKTDKEIIRAKVTLYHLLERDLSIKVAIEYLKYSYENKMDTVIVPAMLELGFTIDDIKKIKNSNYSCNKPDSINKVYKLIDFNNFSKERLGKMKNISYFRRHAMDKTYFSFITTDLAEQMESLGYYALSEKSTKGELRIFSKHNSSILSKQRTKAYNQQNPGQGAYNQQGSEQEDHDQQNPGQEVSNQQGSGQGASNQQNLEQEVSNQQGSGQGASNQQNLEQGVSNQLNTFKRHTIEGRQDLSSFHSSTKQDLPTQVVRPSLVNQHQRNIYLGASSTIQNLSISSRVPVSKSSGSSSRASSRASSVIQNQSISPRVPSRQIIKNMPPLGNIVSSGSSSRASSRILVRSLSSSSLEK